MNNKFTDGVSVFAVKHTNELRIARRALIGFTLIELLIVIAIIGILASIVLVNLSSARNKAQSAHKKSELSQILKLVQMYYINKGAFPANPTSNWCVVGNGTCLRELVSEGYTTSFPVSPDGQPYYYYNYATFGLVASRMNPEEYGSGRRGWHCSDAAGGVTGSKYYCLESDR